MLVIRLQRTGRKGHAQFRMVVQDSRQTPSSGRVVAALGSYNPHTKEAKLDVEKATTYLNNGAQPSDRAVVLLEKEGVKMPTWVTPRSTKERALKNSDKLRKNRPAEPAATEDTALDTVAEPVPTADEVPAVVDEAPQEEPATEPAAESELKEEA